MKYKYPYRRRTRKSPITRELKEKHRRGLTLSPLDLCLRRGFIDKEHHIAANHLIFLHNSRYGLRQMKHQISRCYVKDAFKNNYVISAEEVLRVQQEYLCVVDLLKELKSYNLVMDVCVYDLFPLFLREIKISRQAFQERDIFVTALHEMNLLMVDIMQERMRKKPIK